MQIAQWFIAEATISHFFLYTCTQEKTLIQLSWHSNADCWQILIKKLMTLKPARWDGARRLGDDDDVKPNTHRYTKDSVCNTLKHMRRFAKGSSSLQQAESQLRGRNFKSFHKTGRQTKGVGDMLGRPVSRWIDRNTRVDQRLTNTDNQVLRLSG